MSERPANAPKSSQADHRGRRAPGAFLRDLRGATAIEYALIASLIFAVVASSIKLYGAKVDGVYGLIGNTIAQSN